jgi:hypothetical protein
VKTRTFSSGAVFFEDMLKRKLSSSVGERRAAFERVTELRMRLNCFSSSDCGFEPSGLMVLRLSSVGRCKRLGGDSTWLTVEVGREKMAYDWDCDKSLVCGLGAGLEGISGDRERTRGRSIMGGVGGDLEGAEGTGWTWDTSLAGGIGAALEGAGRDGLACGVSVVGGVGGNLEGAERGASTRDASVVGGAGAVLEGAEREKLPDDSSLVGGIGAALEGASTEGFTIFSSLVGGKGAFLSGSGTPAFAFIPSFFGFGAGLVGGAIAFDFSTSATVFSIFEESFTSGSSGVPHRDWITSSSNSAASSSNCPDATDGFTRSSSFWNGVVGEHCARRSISSNEKAPESMFLRLKSGFAGTAGGALDGSCTGAALSVGVDAGFDFFQKANDIVM